MKFLVNAKITALEDEHTMKVTGRDLQCANAILECGQGGDFICAGIYGKDKITVLKQKMLAGKPVDLILSILGKVAAGKRGGPIYVNTVTVKWILS